MKQILKHSDSKSLRHLTPATRMANCARAHQCVSKHISRAANIAGTALIGFLATLQLSGCAIGPLYGGESARSNGAGRFELSGAKGNAGVAIKGILGVSENFDLGIQWESASLGIRGKYALINNQEDGVSLAAALGTGINWGGSHYYGDLMTSYLFHKTWEPYFIGRVVHVKNDPVKFREDGASDNSADFTIDVPDYNYGQVIAGLRFWPNAGQFVLGLEVSELFSLSDGLDIDRNLLVFGNIGYRFK